MSIIADRHYNNRVGFTVVYWTKMQFDVIVVIGTKFHGTKMCRTFVARGQGKYEDENVLDLKVQV